MLENTVFMGVFQGVNGRYKKAYFEVSIPLRDVQKNTDSP